MKRSWNFILSFIMSFLTIVVFIPSLSANADLELSMTVSENAPLIYTNTTYTLTIFNNGPENVQDIQVEFQLPTGLAFTSSDPSRGSYSTWDGLWKNFSLDNGESASLELVLFTLVDTPITVLAQVVSSSSPDPDSAPNNNSGVIPIEDDEAVISLNLADLELEFLASSYSASPGDEFTISLQITNNGPTAARLARVLAPLPPGLTLLSYNSNTDPFGVIYGLDGIWYIPNYFPNGSVEDINIDVRLENSVISDLDIFAEVFQSNTTDPDSSPDNGTPPFPNEDDETMTVIDIDGTADLRPDIQITNFAGPSSIELNGSGNINFDLGNVGSGPVEQLFQTSLYLSGDNQFDGLDILLDFFNEPPPLNPGQNVIRNFDFTIDANLTAGTYYFIIFADNQNIIDEPNDNNNFIIQQVELTDGSLQLPDLTINTFNVPCTGINNGLSIEFDFDYENIGTAEASLTTTTAIYLSDDAILDSGDELLSSSLIFAPVAVGQTGNIASNIALAQSTQPGNYFLILKTDANEILTELSETNNTFAKPFEIIQQNLDLPNLQLNAFTIGTQATQGEVLSYEFDLINNGSTTAEGDYQIGVYLSNDGGPGSPDDVLVGVVNTGNTPVGTIFDIPGEITIPPNQAPGTYFIVMGADINNDIEETDEFDNQSEAYFFEVFPGGGSDIDLSLSLTVSNSSPPIYTNTTFTLSVNNAGVLPATNVQIEFPLPTGLVFTSQDVPPGTSYSNWNGIWEVGTVESGETISMDLTLFTLTSDEVTNYAQVLSASGIDGDSTPGNGTCCIPNEDDEAAVTINGSDPPMGDPDLTVSNFQIQTSAFPGDLINYTFDLNNIGTENVVGDYTLGVYLSVDQTASADDVNVGLVNTGNTPVGTISGIPGAITIPVNQSPGNYFLILWADDGQVITESNENNNTITAGFEILGSSSSCAFVTNYVPDGFDPLSSSYDYTLSESPSGYSLDYTNVQTTFQNPDLLGNYELDLNGNVISASESTDPEVMDVVVEIDADNNVELVFVNSVTPPSGTRVPIDIDYPNPIDIIGGGKAIPTAYGYAFGIGIIQDFSGTLQNRIIQTDPFGMNVVIDDLVESAHYSGFSRLTEGPDGSIYTWWLTSGNFSLHAVPADGSPPWVFRVASDTPSSTWVDTKVSHDGQFVYVAKTDNQRAFITKLTANDGTPVGYDLTDFINPNNSGNFRQTYVSGIETTMDGGLLASIGFNEFGGTPSADGEVFGKIDATGQTEWVIEYLDPALILRPVSTTSDGGYLFAGFDNNSFNNGDDNETVIIKTTSDGRLSPTCNGEGITILNTSCPIEFAEPDGQLTYFLDIQNLTGVTTPARTLYFLQNVASIVDPYANDMVYGQVTVPQLEDGEYANLTLVATLPEMFIPPGTVINDFNFYNGFYFSFSESGGDPLLEVDVFCKTYFADIAIDLTTDDLTYGNDGIVNYTYTVTNNGPQTAHTILANLGGSGPAIGSFLIAGDPPVGYIYESGPLFLSRTWVIPNLLSGESVSFELGNAMISNPLPSQFFVNRNINSPALPNDSDLENNEASLIFTYDPDSPAGMDLELGMLANQGATYEIYQNIPYEITVSNTGTEDATGVVVSIPLPPGLVYSNQDATQGVYDSWLQTWTVGDIPAGGSAQLDLLLFTLIGDGFLTLYAEIAEASGDDIDSTPGNGICCTPIEDDEAFVVLNSGNNPLAFEQKFAQEFARIKNIYPNPAYEYIVLELFGQDHRILTVDLYDVKGSYILSRDLEIYEGDNQFEMDISQLNEGMYYLHLKGETSRNNRFRFVKQRMN